MKYNNPNKLIFLHLTGKVNKNYQKFALYKCECGNIFEANVSSVNYGNTTSCGCYKKQQVSKSIKTHGMTDTPMYICWANMIKRCNDPSYKQYQNYGGRGIAICNEWKTFQGFYDDMKEGYNSLLELNRIDNNGNYDKHNCNWVTHQSNNRNKRNNDIWEFNGQEKCLTEWAEEYNINTKTLWARINKLNWSFEDALTRPLVPNKFHKRQLTPMLR